MAGFAKGVDADVYRQAFGLLPTAIAVVTTIGDDGLPRGLACNAVTAVSIDPPLLLVCVDHASRTLPALRGSAEFAVNFLAAGSDGVCARFAGKSADKFTGLRYVPARHAGGAPVLAEHSVAALECAVERELDAGDHTVLFGRVRAVSVFGGEPLLYRGGRYGSWNAITELTTAG